MLHINLDELREAILIEIEDKVMNEVKMIADNNKRELVGKLGLLEEVFNLLGVVVVAYSTDVLYFTDLAGAGGCLDILDVDLRIFTEIHN